MVVFFLDAPSVILHFPSLSQVYCSYATCSGIPLTIYFSIFTPVRQGLLPPLSSFSLLLLSMHPVTMTPGFCLSLLCQQDRKVSLRNQPYVKKQVIQVRMIQDVQAKLSPIPDVQAKLSPIRDVQAKPNPIPDVQAKLSPIPDVKENVRPVPLRLATFYRVHWLCSHSDFAGIFLQTGDVYNSGMEHQSFCTPENLRQISRCVWNADRIS